MLAVVRVRGSVKLRKDVLDTLHMLRLKTNNNCVILPELSRYIGMLKKVKDRVTWGKIDRKTLVKLLENRCMLIGNRKLDKENLKGITGFDSFEDFADSLLKGDVNLKDYKKIKPMFKLNPPRKGYKNIRLPYPRGDLGDRGEKINELLERMI